MPERFAFIGFGEAGRALSAGLTAPWRAYDIDPSRTQHATLAEALDGATFVLSTVTADQALIAARAAAPLMMPGAHYLDLNSVAPDTKRAAAAAIGTSYTDVAVMAPVEPARMAMPLLLAGPHAEDAAIALRQAGFANVRCVGPDIGRAASIKLIRSVMIKGIEALTAEMMAAADAAGVRDEVLASLGGDWCTRAAYNLERMATHGARRAAEMEEATRTLAALDVEPVMTRGTIVRQRKMANAPLRAAT
jgi:3-hydroxyisobutyrate dehydrogenase-like beta-hydroxyacid dehydrogenase